MTAISQLGSDPAAPVGTNGAVVVVPGRVSVVIPAYNREATVAAAVESCLAQTYEDVEIIVVDDGSTDRTLDVLNGFGPRIKLISQTNGGVGAARNAGTRAASGEYVALMDSDDLAMPERLSLEAGLLASRPDINLVSTDFSAFTSGKPDYELSHIGTYYQAVKRLGGVASIYPYHDVTWETGKFGEIPVAVRWGQAYELLLWGNFVHPGTSMVRRSVFDEVGFYDETLRYSTEYDWIIRIARIGQFAFIDAPLLRYRVSTTQLSHAAAGGKMPLETVKVLEKVQRDDPALYAKHKAVFQLRLAESFISAAESLAGSDRFKAIGLLARGVRFRLLFHRALHAFAHIVAPGFAIKAIRQVKRYRSIGAQRRRDPRPTSGTEETPQWPRRAS